MEENQTLERKERNWKKYFQILLFFTGFYLILSVLIISSLIPPKSQKVDLGEDRTEEITVTTESSSAPSLPSLPEPDRNYINERLGFEFDHGGFKVIKEEENVVLFGLNNLVKSFHSEENYYELKISISPKDFADFESYKLCSEFTDLGIDEWPPDCIDPGKLWGQEEDIMEIILGKDIKAKSFYLNLGLDNQYHIVQIYNPQIELKMHVAGGRLDERFYQILSTFKII